MKKFIEQFFSMNEHYTKFDELFSYKECKSCHEQEYKAWEKHHTLMLFPH